MSYHALNILTKKSLLTSTQRSSMNQDVKYKFCIKSGQPSIQSNFIFDSLDILELFASDFNTKESIQTCMRRIRASRQWGGNCSMLKYEGNFAIITPGFDWEGEAKIRKSKLLSILREFEEFIRLSKKQRQKKK